MSLKTERAVNEAVMKINASKWESFKRWGKEKLFIGLSAFSIAVGVFGTSQEMSAQNPNVISVPLSELNAYLSGGNSSSQAREQARRQQYAQVYESKESYMRSRGTSVSADGRVVYENGNKYVYSNEFNAGLGRTLNNRAILGVYENYDAYNDFIMVTAPMDEWGRIIPDGRLTTTHHTAEYLRDAQEQGHTGYIKRQNYNSRYNGSHRRHRHHNGRVSDVVRAVEDVIDFARYVGGR